MQQWQQGQHKELHSEKELYAAPHHYYNNRRLAPRWSSIDDDDDDRRMVVLWDCLVLVFMVEIVVGGSTEFGGRFKHVNQGMRLSNSGVGSASINYGLYGW